MNAPEKIYLQVNDDEDELYIKTTWAQDRINDKDIEYVRSDTIRNLGEAAVVTPVMCRALVDAFREERDFDGSKIDESWQWAWNEMSEEVMNAWYEKKRVTGELIDKLDELLKARGN